jgi:hypothetical protein
MLSVRKKRAADRIRTGTARITTSDAAVTPQPPGSKDGIDKRCLKDGIDKRCLSGDDRTRTGGRSPDKRALSL